MDRRTNYFSKSDVMAVSKNFDSGRAHILHVHHDVFQCGSNIEVAIAVSRDASLRADYRFHVLPFQISPAFVPQKSKHDPNCC